MNCLLPSQGVQLGVSPPATDWVLTAEGQQASVGDWGLTQVQHLEHSEVFRQEPQAGVSKLWGTWVFRLSRPRGGDPKAGQEWEVMGSSYEAMPSSQSHTSLCLKFISSF